jgi:hypothetical protein
VLGGCERIRKTLIPFSDSSYIKQFVVLFALVMPLGLVREFGDGHHRPPARYHRWGVARDAEAILGPS